MLAHVASVTLHGHFRNALNAENVSVSLDKAKTSISSVWACLALFGLLSL